MESDSSELSNTVQKMTFSIKEFFSECDQMHRKFFVQCKIKVVLVIFSELIRKCFSLPTTGRFSKSVLVINCFMVGCILRTEIFNPLLKQLVFQRKIYLFYRPFLKKTILALYQLTGCTVQRSVERTGHHSSNLRQNYSASFEHGNLQTRSLNFVLQPLYLKIFLQICPQTGKMSMRSIYKNCSLRISLALALSPQSVDMLSHL